MMFDAHHCVIGLNNKKYASYSMLQLKVLVIKHLVRKFHLSQWTKYPIWSICSHFKYIISPSFDIFFNSDETIMLLNFKRTIKIHNHHQNWILLLFTVVCVDFSLIFTFYQVHCSFIRCKYAVKIGDIYKLIGLSAWQYSSFSHIHFSTNIICHAFASWLMPQIKKSYL